MTNCFELDLEQTIVGYLNSVSSSGVYPIRVGHTDTTSSFDEPIISVTCESWMNVNQACSPRIAKVYVDVCTVAYDQGAYQAHAFSSQEIEQSMNAQPYLINYSYASSSVYIAGVEYAGCSCPVQSNIQFLNSYTYMITAQQMQPSSSTVYC